MNFAFKCWASNPARFPCDVDWSVDPITAVAVGIAAPFALCIAALGFFALIYLLAKGKTQ